MKRKKLFLILIMPLFKLSSLKQTRQLAGLLAQEILSKKNFFKDSALVIALSGDLGAGKTSFAQGFLRIAGVKSKIISPTFVLVKRYTLNAKRYKNIYHIDCYRLHQPKELLSLGLKEIFSNSENIVLIEWPERIKSYLPKNIIKLKFKYGQKESERIIKL